jgi:rare lipoprotein A
MVSMRFFPSGIVLAVFVSAVVLSWPSVSIGSSWEGMASYYGDRFHGRRTASGQRFNKHALTAAHRTLRFGTQVKVTHKNSGRSVIVTINDRGPYARGRIIDISKQAARQLGMLRSGVVPVRVEVVGAEAAGSDPGPEKTRQARKDVDAIWGLFGARGAGPRFAKVRTPR